MHFAYYSKYGVVREIYVHTVALGPMARATSSISYLVRTLVSMNLSISLSDNLRDMLRAAGIRLALEAE